MKDFLGDAVMTTPLIDGLLKIGVSTTIATTPGVRDLLAAPFREPDFLHLGRSRRTIETARAALRLRRGRYSAALLVNRNFRSALTARLAGIKVRVGSPTEGRESLLTHLVPYDEVKNEADCYLDLARAIGYDLPLIEPKLYVTEAERERGKELLGDCTVVIQPSASMSFKQFKLAFVADLVQKFQEDGEKVAFIGGPDEIEASARVHRQTENVLNLVGQTKLRETAGLVTQAKIVIGGDTGVMHIASALGCPTVTVFCGKPESKWGHGGPLHPFLTAPSNDMIHLRVKHVYEPAKALMRFVYERGEIENHSASRA